HWFWRWNCDQALAAGTRERGARAAATMECSACAELSMSEPKTSTQDAKSIVRRARGILPSSKMLPKASVMLLALGGLVSTMSLAGKEAAADSKIVAQLIEVDKQMQRS